MKSLLKDIVSHTIKLGFLTIVKVTSDEKSAVIETKSDDNTVVFQAETSSAYPEMQGVFGLPQLEKLRYLLENKEYQSNAKVQLQHGVRNGVDCPIGLHFENEQGDFKNDYRFMNSEIISEKIKSLKFRGAKWTINVEPDLLAIQRFALQAGANSENTVFHARVENKKLIFTFGTQATHGGEFVFATGVDKSISSNWAWPVAQVLSILKIADTNKTTMSISDDNGAMQIELDSGIAVYRYILPTQV